MLETESHVMNRGVSQQKVEGSIFGRERTPREWLLSEPKLLGPDDTPWPTGAMRRFARGVTKDYPQPTSTLSCLDFYDLFDRAKNAIIFFEPESTRAITSNGYHTTLSYIAAHEPNATNVTFWNDEDVPDNQSDMRARRRFAGNMMLFNIPPFLHDCYHDTQKRQMLDQFMRSYYH